MLGKHISTTALALLPMTAAAHPGPHTPTEGMFHMLTEHPIYAIVAIVATAIVVLLAVRRGRPKRT